MNLIRITDMEDGQITELVIRISGELASLNTNMRAVLEKLTNHENRITSLEQNRSGIRENLLKWLTIALIGCISVIVTLTGATGVLQTLLK